MKVIALAAVLFFIGVSASSGRTPSDASGSLAWSRGGVGLPSYAFPTLAPGSRASANFKLENWGQAASGKFAIHLTGSSAFSISSTGCTGKNLGVRKWCRVAVAYAPSGAGARDHAVLTATREHKTAAKLEMSGCSADGSGHIYWFDGERTLKAAISAGGCITRITALASGVCAGALAADATHVYWADRCDRSVRSVPVGGGTVTTLASGQHYPGSVAVDGTHVVWSNYGSGTVNEVPVGGGTVTTLASGQSYPTSVAVDGTHVVWLDRGGYSSKDGTVKEVPVGGGTVTTLAAGLDYPSSLALNGTHVFWCEGEDAGTVSEVPVGGGTVTTLATGQEYPGSMVVDDTHVYWLAGGMLNELPLGGGSVTALVSGLDATSLALVGTHLYWGEYYTGTVNEVSVGGGKVNLVARGQGYYVSVGAGP